MIAYILGDVLHCMEQKQTKIVVIFSHVGSRKGKIMSLSKKQRESVKDKFGGLCAYSGTLLEDDWQADHIEPIIRCQFTGKIGRPHKNCLENVVPCQRIINHYKWAYPLVTFRRLISTLHLRLKKLPKNPKKEHTIKRKEYVLKVASYFGITEDKPFSGEFYFETINKKEK